MLSPLRSLCFFPKYSLKVIPFGTNSWSGIASSIYFLSQARSPIGSSYFAIIIIFIWRFKIREESPLNEQTYFLIESKLLLLIIYDKRNDQNLCHLFSLWKFNGEFSLPCLSYTDRTKYFLPLMISSRRTLTVPLVELIPISTFASCWVGAEEKSFFSLRTFMYCFFIRPFGWRFTIGERWLLSLTHSN